MAKDLVIQIRQTDEPVREAAAWFIAGSDPRGWLEEISLWGVEQEKVRLFAVPRSMADRGVGGVLVVPGAGQSLKRHRRAIPYGVVAGKLYLPMEAELWPPVEAAELKLLHEVQVFHPGAGLIGFEAKDALKVTDLLRSSPSRVENWNFARPGGAFNTRLRAVTVSTPMSLPDIFGNASEEIGSDPIIDLPPTPDEPKDGPVSNLLRNANRKFSEMMSRSLKGTWLSDLEQWASARMNRLTQEMQSLRNKELNRLLHQLENDPEDGLRHAIPLAQLKHRGLAPPGARLGNKTPNFDLGRLRGGGAADFWDIPPQLRQQLTTRYRELANRELQLGRYRRAAYIFAELLGDLSAAASALKQGRHFREAAVLYKEHLRRPREAAACLAEGGLFTDAIALYEEQSLFLEAGDLYRQIGQPEQAAAAYRLAVEKLAKSGDRVGAAKLLEERLAAVDEALVMLAEGWPHSAQAAQCLEAQFAFLGRHGRNAEGATLVERLRVERTHPELLSRLATLLSRQSRHYPDQRVRLAAADVTRVKVGEGLDSAALSETVQLTDALVKLAAEDRLLARDAVRFVAERNEQIRRRAIPPAPTARGAGIPVLVRKFELPQGFQWQAIKSCGPYFFASGFSPGGRVLLRGNWEGRVQAISWPADNHTARPLALELDETEAEPKTILLVSAWAQHVFFRVPEQSFVATTLFKWVTRAGTWDWVPDDVLAACDRNNLTFLLRETPNGLVLDIRRRDGALVSGVGLDAVSNALQGPLENPSLLVQRDQLLWLANGQQWFLHRQGKALQSWEVESNVLSLVGSPPHLPQCALACLERGVAIQWSDAIKDNVETLCSDLERPLAGFTANGTLVLLSGREGRVCEVRRGQTRVNPFVWPGAGTEHWEPVTVARAQAANEFAVAGRNGEVCLFRIQT